MNVSYYAKFKAWRMLRVQRMPAVLLLACSIIVVGPRQMASAFEVLPHTSFRRTTSPVCRFYSSKPVLPSSPSTLLFSVFEDDIVQDVVETAIQASKTAGALILQHAQGAKVVDTKSTHRDLLTMVDPLCEQTIRETILAKFPNHDILGEEGVEPGAEAAIQALEDKLTNPQSPWLWIVDPIDGTTNFASGIPLNLPSIAVAYRGQVVAGVLYDPHQDELFTAVRGQGAFCNGKAIRVGQEPTLEQATVGMESPAGQASLEMCVRAIGPLMPRVRTIRMLGSSAIMLPWVAANGRLTAYWTPDECAWDIAAGALIVQEAGGRVTDLQGQEYTLRTRSLVASNGKVHQELLRLLQEAEV